MVVVASLKSMILLPLGSCLGFQYRHDFPLVEQALSPIKKLLVTTKVLVALLRLQDYHAMWIIFVVHNHSVKARLLISSLLWKLVRCLLLP